MKPNLIPPLFLLLIPLVLSLPADTASQNDPALPHIPIPDKQTANISPPFTDSQFILKPDAILIPLTHQPLNPDYVTLTKYLDFSNLDDAIQISDEITTQHREVCSTIHGKHNVEPLYTSFGHKQWYLMDQTIIKCSEHGMTTPRPKSKEDMISLLSFMRKYDYKIASTDAFVPNAKVSPSLTRAATVRYPDGSSPFINYKQYWDRNHDHWAGISQDTEFVFEIINSELVFKPGKKGQHRPVICQTRPKDHNLDAEVNLCNARTDDMFNSGIAIKKALDLISSAQPITHDILSKAKISEPSREKSLERDTRALATAVTIGGAIAALGLLTSTTTALHASSKASNNKKAIASIQMDLEGLKREQFRFINETKHILDTMQDVNNLIMHETRLFTAHLNLKLGLQDSVVSHVSLLQDIHYGKYSPLIVSPAELEDLQLTVTDKTARKLSPKVKDYIIRPVLVDGKLAVDIVIPLLDPAKEATIFKLVKIPTFQNGHKLVLDCDYDHVALYENSNSYNPITNEEVEACLTPHEHCYAATPILANSVDHCVARQFNDRHPNNKYKTSPDSTPFFYTLQNVTVYSVPDTTLVDFHCPEINKPGPDLSFNISSRGFFLNPYGNCRFSTQYARFEPPTEKYALTSYIQELFSLALDPRNYNFPKLRKHSITNFQGQNEAAQTASAKTVSLALPILIAILLAFGAAIIAYGCSLTYLKRAKNRLKDKYGGIIDFLDPEGASERKHSNDLKDAFNLGLHAPPVPQAGRPILKRNITRPIRPGHRQFHPYGPATRPQGFSDPFDLENCPLYPTLTRSSSDPSLVKITNGIIHPKGEHVNFYAPQPANTHVYEPIPNTPDAILNDPRYAYAKIMKKTNEQAKDETEPMDTSL